MGFNDIDKSRGCKDLSIDLANQLDSNLNKVKYLLDARFTTVPRHALDAIETEYLISHGGSETVIFEQVGKADILITGIWQKSAEEAATLDAQSKLLEIVDGALIRSQTFVKNYQFSKDEKVKEIKGRLSFATKVGRTTHHTPETAEVFYQLDLKDVL